MKKLNQKGMSLIEVIMTFALIMIIIAGLLTIIMNYRQRIQIETKRLDLVTYKNTLTKEIQDDILEYGLAEINNQGACQQDNNQYTSCSNLVFKNGIEKILAVSKMTSDNKTELKNLLNNKYIKYGDTKYPIEDQLPDEVPEGRDMQDFQNIFISTGDFVSTDSIILEDGTQVKIYSIDIYMEHIDYEDDFGIHIVATDNNTMSSDSLVQDFSYTGDVQEYVMPANGTYKIELWGASGGDKDTYKGGLGAYTSGYSYFEKGTTLYLYIGGEGKENSTVGGYNGGGSVTNGQQTYGSPGGGATDIRAVGGAWDDFNSLKTRMMVAAGGGGANNRNTTSNTDNIVYGAGNGGSGGGLTGYDGESINYAPSIGFESYNKHGQGLGATQIAGGKGINLNNSNAILEESDSGSFGKVINTSQSGGGGGWFAGGSAMHGGAGGGSSYISGHNGCIAINQSSTANNISMKNNSEYESYYFDNTTIIDGDGYRWTDTIQEFVQMPSYDGRNEEYFGNKGDGHIRITYLGI